MRPISLFLAVAFAFAAPVSMAQEGPRPLSSALEAAQSGNWDIAAQLARRAGPSAVPLIEWSRLRDGAGTLPEALAFLDAHSDWPGLGLIRLRAEGMLDAADDAEVLRLFAGDNRPRTGAGALAHARALKSAGRLGDAQADLVLAWRTLDMTVEDQQAMLTAHDDLLSPHHVARVDMLLWQDDPEQVQALLPLLPDGWQALAEARLALRAGRPGVDDLIAAVPDALSDDPGLAHERFLWRIRKGRSDDAIALLLERSESAEALGKPERWAGWRRWLARARMREGQGRAAYKIAASHHLSEGANFADLEWLSGYLALSYLDDPDLALTHFERFRDAVSTPISLGRAGYWLGRAHRARRDDEAARAAFALGAAHQTSFYGLLAAEAAGLSPDPALAGTEAFAPWREAEFTRAPLFRVGLLAMNAGEVSLAERFLLHLADGFDRTALGQMGAMAIELDQPHLAVMIGKLAAGRGIILPGPYYALHPMRQMDLPVPMEMALAIARRESEFDHRVASGAGALGLMQLLPGTASDMARALGRSDHDTRRVLDDWRYNARLGSAYLARLGWKFGGNVVMVSAAYNAGPARPPRWIDKNGDPREGGMDVIDWIEHIPFRETRNYVMRVAESLPIYRARLGRDPHPVPFSEELVGSSVLPLTPKGE
ncbi:lytic transglycosylase domain-containing protein [Sediminimonas qiaohouensis]|uniref:lytic transglycosylase domain-containing protein n=1 Tax=Sediminimonas qiaohouensis TaxID=552061 RepID=UPI000419B86E|nr:lytic transglycosylase domain-containing protein [Sediminimonas qiaohouensis]